MLPLNVGGAFYMNLDYRKDRRKDFEEGIEKIGLAVERFPAFRTDPGYIGCTKSHLTVLKEAKARGYASVLIFEDDFMFLVDKDTFWKTMAEVEKEVADGYDVIMLGYAIIQSKPHSTSLMKVLEGQAPSAYIVHSRMYDRLIEVYEWALPLLDSTHKHWLYINDQAWKKLQPGADWYATNLRIGKQRSGYSDNCKAVVHYENA